MNTMKHSPNGKPAGWSVGGTPKEMLHRARCEMFQEDLQDS